MIRCLMRKPNITRPLQVKKDGALYTGTLEDEEKMIVSGRVNFDAFGFI